MTNKQIQITIGMGLRKTWGNKSKAGTVPCFFQSPLFRPTDYVPEDLRYGSGDCTTCVMCNDNRNCNNYEPCEVGIVKIDKD